MTLPVKWYHSMMRGFPVVTGQPGKLIALLDACLVNGFGQVSSNSFKVENNILTIDLANSETFEKYSVVAINGDDQLNGEYRVIEATKTYIKIKVDLPNQVFTNTIYIKYAPLGWSKITPNTPANTALYIPKESFSNFKFWVNDNYGYSTHVKICDDVTDQLNLSLSNLVNYVPVMSANYSLWWKSHQNISNTRSSFLIGDGSLFYYQWGDRTVVNGYPSLRLGKTMVCGDIIPYLKSDYLATVLTNDSRSSLNTNHAGSVDSAITICSTPGNNYLNTTSNIYSSFLGDINRIKGNNFAGRISEGYQYSNWSGLANNSNYLENSLTGKLELSKILAVSDQGIRGEYPGVFFIPNQIPAMDDLNIEEGTGALADKLILFKVNSKDGSYDYSGESTVAYDITGPWR